VRFFVSISIVIVLATVPLRAVSQVGDSLTVKPVIMLPDTTILRTYGAAVLSTDSLLRWQHWSGFGEWASRQSQFTARDLGGYGRNAGISSTSFSVNTDRVRWNGVIINNPLSGQYNSAEIPFDQTSEVLYYDKGVSEFGFNPQIYSVVKPLTVVRYEQSSYEYRNLDGLLAMPVSDKWMVQASYQGQKDDGKYVQSNFVGRRSTGNIRYVVNSKWTTSAFWLYQGAEMQESMGYQFSDPSNFLFDRFRAQSRSGNTASMRRFFLMGVSMRPNNAADAQGVTLYRKLHRHEWRTSDTTAIRAQEWGLSAQYEFAAGKRLRLQPYLDATFVSDNVGNILLENNLGRTMYNVGIRNEYRPIDLVALLLHAEASGTMTGKGSQLDIAGRAMLPLQATITLGYAVSSAATPSIYEAATSFTYTRAYLSDAIEGATWYVNVIKPAGLWRYRLNIRDTRALTLPALGSPSHIATTLVDRVSKITGAIERDSDNSEIMLGFNSVFWEFPDGLGGLLKEQRFLSSAFWKGYVFDKAAYLKGGAVFSTTITDTRPATYVPELGIWLPNMDGRALPAHHRLDLEFAARVRSLILSGRLENTLDGWTQKGYFQTLPYPMPGRRFRIGLKVHFRD
jgi:hypothetical protein